MLLYVDGEESVETARSEESRVDRAHDELAELTELADGS